MTTVQRKTLECVIFIVGAVATMSFSVGLARRELDGKEDRESHQRDLREVDDRLREERQLRALQVIRDSAQMSIVLARITELACDQNPHRSYCR